MSLTLSNNGESSLYVDCLLILQEKAINELILIPQFYKIVKDLSLLTNKKSNHKKTNYPIISVVSHILDSACFLVNRHLVNNRTVRCVSGFYSAQQLHCVRLSNLVSSY